MSDPTADNNSQLPKDANSPEPKQTPPAAQPPRYQPPQSSVPPQDGQQQPPTPPAQAPATQGYYSANQAPSGQGPSGPVPPNYVPPTPGGQPPYSSPASGLAITAMILGIASVVLSWVYVGLALGIGGIIFGVIAANKKQSKGMWITGIITGAIGALLSIAMIVATIFVFSAARQASESIKSSYSSYSESYASANAPKDVTIKFVAKVEKGKATARYYSSAGSSNESFDGTLEKTVPTQIKYSSGYAMLSVSSTDYSITDNKVVCEIYVDGKLVNTNQGSTYTNCNYTITK